MARPFAPAVVEDAGPRYFELDGPSPMMLAGEPIVESPDDALRTFLASGMDLLVPGDHIVRAPGRGSR